MPLRTLLVCSSRLAYRTTPFVPEHLVASTSRAAFHSSPRRRNEGRRPQPTSQPESAPAQTKTTVIDSSDPSFSYTDRFPRPDPGPEKFTLHPDQPSNVHPGLRRDGTAFNPDPTAPRQPPPHTDITSESLFEDRSVPRLGNSDVARNGGSMASDRPRYAPITNDPEDESITHVLYVHVTRNNIHLSFQDAIGKLGSVVTGGTDRAFKGQGRSTFEAAHQAICKMMGRIQEYSDKLPDSRIRIRMAFKGVLGQGREAIIAAINGPTGDLFRPFVGRIDDRTPLKFGGNRGKKPRRI